MRRILATTAALCLGGCITVYGPVKTGRQQQQDSQAGQQPGMSEQTSTSFIGNRKPDELLNAVALYFREKAITASVNDQTTGIIAGIGAHNHAIHTGAYAYLHAVSPGIHSHGYHLNPEYLSGVKNDV
ncbi:hypothetical protein AAT96_05460 [Salmonella enterica subsp. enterica]|nr:hypothetical protein [Salmonella enterica subsp. enterica]